MSAIIIRIVRIELVLVVLLVSVTAPGQAVIVNNLPPKPFTIAFVPKSLDNPIFLDTLEAAQKKAYELGVRLEWVAPFTTSTEEQIKVVNNLIRRKVDGIIISANDPGALKGVINRAVQNGIAVATFDSDVPGSDRLFYVGTDNKKAGYELGKALVKVVKRKNKAHRNLKTMVLSGGKEALNLKKRITGFNEAVAGELNIEINDVLYCYDDFQLANELVEGYLKIHPDIDIILFVGGWPFYVPPDAMPRFQKWARKGGIAVGIDIFYSALVLQKEGMIQYLVGQDFGKMGELSLFYLVNYLRYGQKPPVIIKTGIEHANRSNLDKLLKIHKPWGVR